jgi:hypothetical protein
VTADLNMRKQFLTCLLVLSAHLGFTQITPSIEPALEAVRADSNSSIYNGSEHIGYPAALQGNPFYGSDQWQKSSIIFRDELYTDVYLKYDLVKNEVVLRHFNGFTGIVLFTPRIRSFNLGPNHFVNLPSSKNLPGGIYEEIVAGTVSLYARRIKTIEETLTATGVERKVSGRNIYFVYKDGKYYPVRNEKSVLDLVKDKKSQVKAHLKESGIKYKRNAEAALITIITYYNQSSR